MSSEESATEVGHCKADETDVYVGRGPGGQDMLSTPVGKRGWLGNPHSVDDYGREGSIERFRKAFEHRLENDETFRNAVRRLAGKRLGCWCQRLGDDSPACHGEVIAEHADRLAEEQPAMADGGAVDADRELQKLFDAHDALREAEGKPMPADAKEGVEEAREILEGMIQEEVA